MDKTHNYTGFAVPRIDKNGKLHLVQKRKYEDVGMYCPCLKLENGIAVASGLGGFSEDSVNDPASMKHYDVYLLDTTKRD